MNRHLTIIALIFLLCAPGSTRAKTQVADTKHNLSSSGPGQFKSQTEDRICVFCHTPHLANIPKGLWNRISAPIGNRYASSTSDAVPSLRNKASELCLSCHDGTIALGEINSRPRGGKAENDLRSVHISGRGRFGRDLSNHHPVAIMYDEGLQQLDNQLVSPMAVELPLPEGELHCTSCHDPHDSINPPFLHKASGDGELCLECHSLSGDFWDWSDSDHSTSEKSGTASDPWRERKPEWKGKTVANNACMNCHAPHNSGSRKSLMVDDGENVCFRCHDGTMARGNLREASLRFYRHPVDRYGLGQHESAREEDPNIMPLHVECEDCHNPHASQADSPMVSFDPSNPFGADHIQPPLINKTLLGVSGIDAQGSPVAEVQYEYELCFKCHGVPGKNACENDRCTTAQNYLMNRQDNVYNLREKVAQSSSSVVSYHPIESNNPFNDGEVPSLRNDIPINSSDSLIYCSDCHNSDSSAANGGNGPSGPHGSRHEGLLALNFDIDPTRANGRRGSALCLKCHDSASLFGDESFPHNLHVMQQNASCSVCHDPHGSAVYPHLINFMTSASIGGDEFRITGVDGTGEPEWEDRGTFSGACYLSCHGSVHDGTEYPQTVEQYRR